MDEENVTIADATKVGARNSRRDKQTLQVAHDALVDAGAACEYPEEKHVDTDEVVFSGSSVKAVKLDDGSVKLGGYLITFGDEHTPDLTGDFFTKDTDFGDAEKSDGWFNHRIPVSFGGQAIEYKKKLGRAELRKDDIGVFAEIILKARDAYEQAIVDAGLAGKLGWSSGTAGHLVEREQVGKAWKITSWPLGLDASLTPTPAEPRNSVIPLKSLGVNSQVEGKPDAQDKSEAEAKPETIQEVKNLGDKKMTLEIDEVKLQELVTQASEAGYKKAIEDTEPVKTAGGNIQVTEAEEDRPFKSIGENLVAVREDFITHGNSEKKFPRMRFLKATGASEGVPSDGGFLLDPTITSEIIKPIHEEGPFSNDVRKLPVGNNSNSGWINAVAENSRETGSRWGGVRGYWLAEAATKTASKPTFRRIQWELKKVAAVVVATDELLQDSAQFSAIVRQAVPEELKFLLNDAIMNGLGVSTPQGFMQSGALISAPRDTANLIIGTDISGMWQRMSLGSKAKAKWYANVEVAPQLDKLFAVGSTAVLFPYAGYTANGVRTLYGRPIVETEFNAALGTTGDIVLADLSAYLLWEKGGIQEETSIHVYFLSDETAFRFVMRVDGASAYNAPLTPYKGTLTTSPFVALVSAS